MRYLEIMDGRLIVWKSSLQSGSGVRIKADAKNLEALKDLVKECEKSMKTRGYI